MARLQRDAEAVFAREEAGTPAAPGSWAWVSVRQLLLQGPIVFPEGDRNHAEPAIELTGIHAYDVERAIVARNQAEMTPYRREACRRLLALPHAPDTEEQRVALSEQLQLYDLDPEVFGIRDAGGDSLHLAQRTYQAYLLALSSSLTPDTPPVRAAGEDTLIDLGFSPVTVMLLLEREGGLDMQDRVAALVPALRANGFSVERIGDVALEPDGLQRLEAMAAGLNPASDPAAGAGAAGGRSPHRPGWLR